MNFILAIVGDTWQQSKQQVVFIIMLCLMILVALAFAILPTSFEGEDGDRGFGLLWSDESTEFFDFMWSSAYFESQSMSTGEQVVVESEKEAKADESREEARKRRQEARRATAAARSGLTGFERSTQAWIYLASTVMFTISMWLYLAACSGYFPGLMAAGAIDVVLSKPVDRWKIFVGKYLGGLALFSMALLVFYFILFVGIGLRIGVWYPRMFAAIPIQIFIAGTLYALLAFLGILSRGPLLPTILGFILYMVVDTGLGVAQQLVGSGMADDWLPWLRSVVDISRMTIPNFTILKDFGLYSVLSLPNFVWRPFLTAFVWMVVSLGLGYWIFRRRDF